MYTIFQNSNKAGQLAKVAITTIMLLAVQVTAEKCSQIVFDTSFTHCQIQLNQCQSNLSLSHQNRYTYKFKNCKISLCTAGPRGENCTTAVEIGLQQETCYWSCCQTKTFDPSQCKQNNIRIKEQSDNINQVLALVLTFCAFFLLLAIACFAVNWLECFKKQVPPASQPQTPAWTKHLYCDRKCNICQQYGSVIETSCKHFFHVSCYNAGIKTKMGKGNCPSCEEMSKKFRLWCDQCHQRYIKIGVENAQSSQQLQLFLRQAKKLHVDCLSDLQSDPKTDARFTTCSSS